MARRPQASIAMEAGSGVAVATLSSSKELMEEAKPAEVKVVPASAKTFTK